MLDTNTIALIVVGSVLGAVLLLVLVLVVVRRRRRSARGIGNPEQATSFSFWETYEDQLNQAAAEKLARRQKLSGYRPPEPRPPEPTSPYPETPDSERPPEPTSPYPESPAEADSYAEYLEQ